MPLYHKKRKPLLSSTRSHHLSQNLRPSTPSATSTLSSNHARTLIRQHHVLQKRLAAARAAHDQSLTSALEAQIATLGGLARYQRASLAGQAKTRGGDSSKVLVRWIYEMIRGGGGEEEGNGGGGGGGGRERGEKKERRYKCEGWRMLEVGALRVDNAAARSGLFTTVERIDLHAQERGIFKQDFMERPFPAAPEKEGFDLVSLSLVLNYVGDPAARGEMLRRVEGFLRKRRRKRSNDGDDDEERENDEGMEQQNDLDRCSWWLPGLFLVLPAPCVTNSRYLDEDRLEAMMRGLGYVRAKRKLSSKLIYYFWRWEGGEEGEEGREEGRGREECGKEGQGGGGKGYTQSQSQTQWPKTELGHRKGTQRNNFAVVFK